MKKVIAFVLIYFLLNVSICSAENITKKELEEYIAQKSTEGERFAKGEIITLGTDMVVERDGVIYILGYTSPEEEAQYGKSRKARAEIRRKQIEDEIRRAHEIKIEQIRAEAIKGNLKAQEFLYRERTDAVKKSGTRMYNRQRTSVENTTNAYSGGSTATATGTGGSSTNTNTTTIP